MIFNNQVAKIKKNIDNLKVYFLNDSVNKLLQNLIF